MWDQYTLTKLNKIATHLNPREALSLLTSPLRKDRIKAKNLLNNQKFVCPSCGENCPVEEAKN